MSADQFRLFIVGLVVVGIVGAGILFIVNRMQGQARIERCTGGYETLRSTCEFRERRHEL